MRNVNSQDIKQNIESLLKARNTDDLETIGFRYNNETPMSDLHIDTIANKLMKGGYLDNIPKRKRYENIQMGAGYRDPSVNMDATNSYEVDLSTDSDAVLSELRSILGVQDGGFGGEESELASDTEMGLGGIEDMIRKSLASRQSGGNVNSDNELVSLDSENIVGNFETFLKAKAGQMGGAAQDSALSGAELSSLCSDNLERELTNLLKRDASQSGGFLGLGDNHTELPNVEPNAVAAAEYDDLNSENIESLKSTILSQLAQQRGGNMDQPAAQPPKQDDIYSSISEADLKKLRDMILNQPAQAQQQGGNVFSATSSFDGDLPNIQDLSATSSFDPSRQAGGMVADEFSATSSQPLDYSRFGLVGGADDASESSESSESDQSEKSEKSESDSEDDNSVDSDSAEERASDSVDVDVGASSSASESGVGSSELKRLRSFMDADAYIAASNSNSSENDFNVNVQDFYTSDSTINTYKGNDSGSEYFNTLKHRDRSLS
jgi:hypothetical protein